VKRRSLGLKVPQSQTALIEISINDKPFKTLVPVAGIDIKWPEKTSGVYDIRVTLTGLDRTRPRVTFPFEIDVQGEYPTPSATITKTRTPAQSHGYGDDGTTGMPIEVKLECPGADRIELEHFQETVAQVDSDEGIAIVETKMLGGGPLRFRPVAYFGETAVRGRTLIDQVEASK
jgi:hypothetical protein